MEAEMLDDFRLYWRYIAISLRGQMQYRASFLMLTFGHFLVTGIEFLGLLVMFNRFENIRGWRLQEVALFYAVVNISFSFADAFSTGFDMFAGMVKGGQFDRLLLRPRSTALQLAGQELTLRRAGRLIQGVLVLVWASTSIGVVWNAGKVFLLLFTIAGGACMFFGIFVLQATVAFWTIESLEVMNAFTYGGVETAQYPLSIYRTWFRKFFTYIVPLACVSYFPILAILGKEDVLGSSVLFQCLSPCIGFLFFFVTLRLWRVGERHYCSTGS
jgi:ABC-2 type transport system permease protein